MEYLLQNPSIRAARVTNSHDSQFPPPEQTGATASIPHVTAVLLLQSPRTCCATRLFFSRTPNTFPFFLFCAYLLHLTVRPRTQRLMPHLPDFLYHFPFRIRFLLDIATIILNHPKQFFHPR